MTDSRISEGLYDHLGIGVAKMKKAVRAEMTRGIAANMRFEDIARNISFTTKAPLENAKNIVRTEGHRIQQESAADARQAAKSHGADVVKQWDATLDGKTRADHRRLDGQIREADEPFEVNGKKAMHPGDFGDPAEDCNCRCVALTRARWALGEDELQTLKDRAAFFGLDKTEDFEDYKNKYLKAAETVENAGESGIIKVEAQNGLKVEKLTKHSLERAAERGIDTSAIEDSLKNPLHIGDVITDEFGRKSQRFVGKTATVNVNPDTGEIVTIWRTGERYYKKYSKGK